MMSCKRQGWFVDVAWSAAILQHMCCNTKDPHTAARLQEQGLLLDETVQLLKHHSLQLR
jgi:hypothetical protein